MNSNYESLFSFFQNHTVTASAPCRIDMGGTLDIPAFYLFLREENPLTVNIAVDLRTTVRLTQFDAGAVKISSTGFDSAIYPADQLPLNHPMGLMFAIAAYFHADGVHIEIHSGSPPKSSLGGSSAAAVALIGAFSSALAEKDGGAPMSKLKIVQLAYQLESAVAGIPCGMQDHLAPLYGGVNNWYWPINPGEIAFRREPVLQKRNFRELERHLLIAYCGVPHESKNINQKWIHQFLSGSHREDWKTIVRTTHEFSRALADFNFTAASEALNTDSAIRRKFTPDVFDDMGNELAKTAFTHGCGCRFAGAGGGGCIWALGEIENIARLKISWEGIVQQISSAALLPNKIANTGLICDIQKH